MFTCSIYAETIGKPELNAEAAILMDADTGVVLFKKNIDKAEYPASVTKVMTCLLTLENCALDERVLFSEAAINDIPYDSSHIAMNPGDTLLVEDALLGLMLASANEVANALAEHVGGTRQNFFNMMNARAAEIGAYNTHFSNANGLHDDQHYTTAYDMALILREAIKNETFSRLISTVSYEIPPTETQEEPRRVNNSNKMIYPESNFYNADIVGGKTGYTSDAMHTLVSLAQRDGVNLVSVVFRTEKNYIYYDTTALLNYGFAQYRETRIFDANDYYATATILLNEDTGDTTEISLYAQDDIRGVYPGSISEYSVGYDLRLNDDLTAPINKGAKLGVLCLTYQGLPLAEAPLYASQSVDAPLVDAEWAVEAWAETKKTVYEPRPTEYADGFRFDFAATLLGNFVQSLSDIAIEPIYFTLTLIALCATGLVFACATLAGYKRKDKEKELLKLVNKTRRKKVFNQ
jgi:D-alanyl-D-alanine carboxypeptidase/D-alanyl-D-alanine carboxypeptidase (penicillin-binding protein 5/6)